jgi:hypothetical protein
MSKWEPFGETFLNKQAISLSLLQLLVSMVLSGITFSETSWPQAREEHRITELL